MNMHNRQIIHLLNEVMMERQCKPNKLAAELRISPATVSRWLSGQDIPSPRSCQKLAEYSGIPEERILSIVGHLKRVADRQTAEWPEFREYAQHKYPAELDDDIIIVIEDLIKLRRAKQNEREKP
jgi:transcriptional regulator with XRE-family HTH domain